MATTTETFTVLSLREAALAAREAGSPFPAAPPTPDDGDRARVRLRSELGIGSFGTSAVYQGVAGARVIGEHDELGPGAGGHEELYVVVAGGCTFTVDGEEVDAPQGSVVFVGDPAAKRAARATADGTVVLAVGGRPGEAFRPSPGEAIVEFFRLHGLEDYEGALAVCREALEEYPGNAMILYNIACAQALLGHPDEAIGSLQESLAAWPAYKGLATADDDLTALRGDKRFKALVA